MNASIHLTHSFAFSAFFMEISLTTVGFENGQNLKLIFEKECIKAKNNKTPVPPKSYPIKFYTPSAMHYQNLN